VERECVGGERAEREHVGEITQRQKRRQSKGLR